MGKLGLAEDTIIRNLRRVFEFASVCPISAKAQRTSTNTDHSSFVDLGLCKSNLNLIVIEEKGVGARKFGGFLDFSVWRNTTGTASTDYSAIEMFVEFRRIDFDNIDSADVTMNGVGTPQFIFPCNRSIESEALINELD